MFGIFKKKTKAEKLQKKYESLMKEAYKLSKINRTASDEKYFLADKVLKEIDIQRQHLL